LEEIADSLKFLKFTIPFRRDGKLRSNSDNSDKKKFFVAFFVLGKNISGRTREF